MKKYIIDAFNVIHKSSELRAKLGNSPAIACNSLLSMISVYSAKYPSYSFIFAVDGHFEDIFISNIKIKILTSKNQTADQIIKDQISLLTNTKNYFCITSDTEVHNFARIHGCQVISSEKFLKEIQTSQFNQQKTTSKFNNIKSEKPTNVSKKSIEEFKKLFES
jgi:predicted RNA-binding protein with PIN domain